VPHAVLENSAELSAAVEYKSEPVEIAGDIVVAPKVVPLMAGLGMLVLWTAAKSNAGAMDAEKNKVVARSAG